MQKKILLTLATAALSLCGFAQTPADTAAVDGKSYSYAFGILQGDGLKQHLLRNEDVDSANFKDVVKGINANPDDKKAKQIIAFAAGLKISKMNRGNIAKYINKSATGKEDTVYFSLPDFNDAITTVLLNGKSKISAQKAQQLIQQQMNYAAQLYQKANVAFLAANAKAPGVVTLPSGLQYRILEKGNGPCPSDTSTVQVHYEGKLIDGQIFDSSYRRGEPATFGVTQVIKGWTEALQLMHEGATWELFIPAELAYGERDMQTIPPHSTLIFKVQLLKSNAK